MVVAKTGLVASYMIMSYVMGVYKSLQTCRFKDGCPAMDGSSTPWVWVWLDETNAVGTNYPDTNKDGVRENNRKGDD